MFASSKGLPQFKLVHETNRPLANASLTYAIEASTQPDFVNLWPAVEFGLPGRTTPLIYGRIYEAGLTEAAGAAPNIVAQLGYGPSGSDPRISADWVWVDASYSMQLGDEDRYAAAFIAPDEVGTFAYTFRFAIDDGINPLSFTYADLDGNGTNAGLGFDSGQLGLLNITPEYVGTSGADIFTATSSEEWTISGLGGDDVLSGAGGWDSISGGEGNDHLIGGDGDDHLRGGDGNDILEGGGGTDAMEGGLGDDLFIVNAEVEEIVGTGHEGYDTILVDPNPDDYFFAYVLPNVAVEVVTTRLEGTQRINITGNSMANILIGNSGENRLSGGGGNDHLIGNGGDDVLVGGAGADILEGGTGDDEYGPDSTDTIIEKPGEGYDSIRVAATNYYLAAGVEIELLSVPFISTTAVNVTGNEFGQRITGNFGVNRLYGEAGDDELFGLRGDDILHGGTGSDWLDGDEGADKLHGDAGNDIYVVDTASDRVFEAVSEGNDLVYASASFNTRVGVEVEVLRAIDATSTAAIDLGGNEFSQTLVGNAGANVLHGRGGSDSLAGHGGNDTLDGGTGSDKLYGGAGDDKYRVDTASDRVIEVAGAGRDIVFASANYGLRSGTEIEVLRTSNDAATTSINLSGNEFAQIIVGNAGANVINGGGGDDTLIGRGGADDFIFSHLGGTDHVLDLETGVDTIDLSALDANSVAAGDQAFAFIGDNTFGGVAGQLRTYISDGKRYVAGDVNGDGVADFTIDFGTSTVGSLDFIL